MLLEKRRHSVDQGMSLEERRHRPNSFNDVYDAGRALELFQVSAQDLTFAGRLKV